MGFHPRESFMELLVLVYQSSRILGVPRQVSESGCCYETLACVRCTTFTAPSTCHARYFSILDLYVIVREAILLPLISTDTFPEPAGYDAPSSSFSPGNSVT